MQPLTRSQLLEKSAPELVRNHQWAEESLPEIYWYVLEASKTMTSYTHYLRSHLVDIKGFNMNEYVGHLCDRLKQLFPDSMIDYVETKSSINGNVIERTIRIDWS
jgi:hypothetical protein